MAQPDDVKKLLRSLLISQKGGVPLQLLANDYRSLIGDHIPYNRFGFRTLEEYLKSIPDVVTIQRSAEGYICCPVADAASAHVHSLVSRQRTQKKKKSSQPRRPSRPTFFTSRKAPVRRNFGPQSATKSAPARYVPRSSNIGPTKQRLVPLMNSTPRNGPSRASVNSTPRNGPSGPSLKPVKMTQPEKPAVGSGLPPRLQRRLGQKTSNTATIKTRIKSSSRTVAISNLPSSFSPALIKKHFGSMKPVDTSLDQVRRCVLMKFENVSASDVRDKFDGSLFIGLKGTSSKICITVEPDSSQAEEELSVLQKIQKMIEDKPHGLWQKNLRDEYRKVYGAEMHNMSVDDLETVVTVEKLHNNIILYPKMKVTIQGRGQVQRTISNEIPKVTILPPVLKPVKSRVVVYVSYVLSCGEFFVQYDDSPVVGIAERLFNQCESCSQPMTRYSKGEFCAAQYSEDNNWCRAKILEVNRAPKALYREEQGKEQDEIQVFFVDYGNQESLRPTSLQFLTPVFGKEPCQAVKCSLNGVNPLQGEKRFSSEANTRFRELTKDIPLLMTIEDITNEKCFVNLSTSNDVDLVHKLCQEELVCGMYPPPLVYPEESPWDVTITYSTSTVDFCIQFDQYSEQFEALEAEINTFYSKPQSMLKGRPELGKAYAVCTGSTWFRVVACGLAGSKVMCDYVDYGDKEVLDWSQFRNLEKKFLHLPYQGVKCSLANLAQFANHAKVFQAFMEQAEDKILVAERTGKKATHIEVILYDATGPGDPVNINELLAKLVEDEDLAPQLPKVGKKIEGYVCHVEDDGVLSLQIPGPGFERLESLMINMAEHFSKPSSANEFLVEPKVGKLCCAKYSQDNNWYRGVITEIVSNTAVCIKFVDYGNSDIVSMTSLREPMINNTTLITLPYQALACVLEGVPPDEIGYKWGLHASSWLFELLADQPVSIEVVRGQTDQRAASVRLTLDQIVVNDSMVELADELFQEEKPPTTDDDKVSIDYKDIISAKQMQDTNGNINKHGAGEPVQAIVKDMARVSIIPAQLRRPAGDVKTVPVMNTPKRLPMPPLLEIPSVGEYWDVVVSWVKDPSHFVCQPFVLSELFKAMLLQMKQYYSTNRVQDLPFGGIQDGEIYAVYLNDRWQRAQACEVNNKDYVNVYRVDEGDYDLVELNDIRPLIQQFRTLPFQGVIARLAGVVPMDNCKFYSDDTGDCFKKLVKGKAFVSTIKEKVEESFHKFKLTVDLTDTSNEQYDVCMNSVLVDAQLALMA